MTPLQFASIPSAVVAIKTRRHLVWSCRVVKDITLHTWWSSRVHHIHQSISGISFSSIQQCTQFQPKHSEKIWPLLYRLAEDDRSCTVFPFSINYFIRHQKLSRISKKASNFCTEYPTFCLYGPSEILFADSIPKFKNSRGTNCTSLIMDLISFNRKYHRRNADWSSLIPDVFHFVTQCTSSTVKLRLNCADKHHSRAPFASFPMQTLIWAIQKQM